MKEYEIYRDITALEGVRVDPQTGTPTLSDPNWKSFSQSKHPNERSIIEKIKKKGFPHVALCSLVLQATGKIKDHSIVLRLSRLD